MASVDPSLVPAPGPTPVVALATSRGGLRALHEILSGLGKDFGAPILIVQHRASGYEDLLAGLLGSRTALRVKNAEQGELPVAGTAYVAPPGHHLVLTEDGRLSVPTSDPVRFSRPSADLLFGSLAAVHSDQAIAVVLTGSGTDGARGIREVRDRGGFVIAQDRETSVCFDMPQAAIDTGGVDLVLPLNLISFALNTLIACGSSAGTSSN